MPESHQVCKGDKARENSRATDYIVAHAHTTMSQGYPQATSNIHTTYLIKDSCQGLPLAGRDLARRLCAGYGDSWSSPRRRLEKKPFIPHCCFVGYATSNSGRRMQWPRYRRRGPQM